MRSTILYDTYGISVCLVAIVKNESHIITEMLKSMLPYFNCYLIADTGSTDATKQVIETFMEQHSIPGEIFDVTWKNFGQARSELMKRCHDLNTVTYAFMMDADDRMVGNFRLDFLIQMHDAYFLQLKTGTSLYKRLQIFKIKNNSWFYKGAVHEYAMSNMSNKLPLQVQFITGNYYLESRRLGARNKDQKKKFQNEVRMLLEELEEEPENTRTQFYLASAYFHLQDWSHALNWYTKRLETKKFWEEEWWSTIRTAECYLNLNNPNKAKEIYHQALTDYPQRAEQFYDLAVLYEKEENCKASFEIAKLGCQIDKPKDNLLWFDERIYDVSLPWQRFQMAWKIKSYDEVLVAAKHLSMLHFKEKKHLVNMYVRRASKALNLTTPFIDFPLYKVKSLQIDYKAMSNLISCWVPWFSHFPLPCL